VAPQVQYQPRAGGFPRSHIGPRLRHGELADDRTRTPGMPSYPDRVSRGVGVSDGQANLRTVRRCLLAILFASIFLQRFAVPIGPNGVSVNLFVNLAALAMLLLRRQLNIDPIRAALVLMFAAYASICAIFNGGSSSWSSAMLLIATYIPFVFLLRSLDAPFKDCLRAYQSMVLVCAVCGIAQFFLHFVISSKLLYTFEGFLPSGILLEGFDNLLPINYGSPINRSNGFFMVEPSTFSQYVALAIIIEMLFFQVKWRLAVFIAALLFSYSGTGLFALVLVPGILVSRRSYGTIFALVLFGCLALATSGLWHMDVAMHRGAEFNNTESSGYARFLAPADLIDRYLISDPHDLLFGVGPGSMRDYIQLMPYETHDPAWAKLLFEYGLLGSALFWAMFVLAVFGHAPSLWLSCALTIGFLCFGGELLDPRLQALLLVFCVLPKRPAVAASHLLRPERITVSAT
jgi:hypothetical protein